MDIDDPGALKMESSRQLRSLCATAVLAIASLAQAACAATPPPGAAGADANANAEANANANAADSTANASGQRFWYDGEHRKPIRVDPEWVVDFRNAKPDFERRDSTRLGTEKSNELAAGVSPVLRDANGEPRALPGGVIVRLRDADLADPRKALADAGLEPTRPIDPQQRTWLVASPAGLESLALANRLHESGRFEAVTPNWWRPRALK